MDPQQKHCNVKHTKSVRHTTINLITAGDNKLFWGYAEIATPVSMEHYAVMIRPYAPLLL